MKLRQIRRVKKSYRSRGTKRRIKKIMNFLEQNEQARAIVGTTIDLLAATNPTVRTLFTIYRTSREMHDVVSRYYEKNARSKKRQGRKKRKR